MLIILCSMVLACWLQNYFVSILNTWQSIFVLKFGFDCKQTHWVKRILEEAESWIFSAITFSRIDCKTICYYLFLKAGGTKHLWDVRNGTFSISFLGLIILHLLLLQLFAQSQITPESLNSSIKRLQWMRKLASVNMESTSQLFDSLEWNTKIEVGFGLKSQDCRTGAQLSSFLELRR